MTRPNYVRAVIKTPRYGFYKEVDLPCKRVLCGRCDGERRVVNPNIDDEGLTGSDIRELGGECFLDEYLSGTYDVKCPSCEGQGFQDIVDIEALSERVRHAYLVVQEEIEMSERERYWEARWGA